jgi:outer membrane protein TolC
MRSCGTSQSILSHSLFAALLFFAAAPCAGADPTGPAPSGKLSVTLPTQPPADNAASTAAPTEVATDIDMVLRAVLAHNGQIAEAMGDVEVAKAQVAQARAAALPHGNATLITAPIFKETGDALHSQSDWSTWGPYVTGGVQLIQPLFSFGQLSNYRKAADNQVIAKNELVNVKRDEILVTAKDFYYSYLMARDLEKLVEDLTDTLSEAIKTAEESLNGKKKTAIKPHDVYHLKTAYEDLEQKKLAATAGKQTAERALHWITTNAFASIPAKTLTPETFEKKTLDEYLALARTNRPEFRALTAGQEAYNAFADAKQAQDYPLIFAGGFFSGAYTPVRTSQPSVFAYDPYNNVAGGAGLGVRIDLEFWRHSAEAAEQRAQAMKLKATESYAGPGIELQVRKAYLEMDQAIEGLKIAEDRRTLARRWFISDGMGWSIGVLPAKDLLEALEGSGLARMNYIQTVYQYNMALAHLSQAVGKEVADLHYR